MISIIIPTFNEEESIGELISYLKADAPKDEIEIIISDGGSTDSTKEIAQRKGAVVIETPKQGRAAQMNFGAKHAIGDMLYFLHADTYPPKAFLDDIIGSLSNGDKAGCYRLSFDDDHPLLKFYCWFTRFDIDFFRFGDQSLFIKKSLFEKLKGFNEQFIVMEDQDIVRRIKKKASFTILPKQVVTSARKYRQVGILKLQLIFTIVLIRFYLGTPQKKLIEFYKRAIN
ncbi:MAG: TIGR04283 family arsenosugar biosynthesis glycosyltransferase [Balneolaceae bacterium]|nr:TIGR04283 family arsenosugar biosynthesis glycosyltransferase [Balneolaceae bacterium]MBO6545187.1 TIGR04283 family arsenosugar biosynthesis glycosyltransferase [Balneolaceae bacterium]MBO6646583.1 TIGR04283 family arsenosugar biosynthesis glycosyltransferase [Balneolaceae bacterium]